MKRTMCPCGKMFVFLCLLFMQDCYALSDEARSKGFVELPEIDPSIIIVPRYSTPENFMGVVVDGYKKQTVVVLKEVALALKQAQIELKKDGYCMVVYDAYRPQQAVDHFMRWIEQPDEKHKADYYPRVDKSIMVSSGYIIKRSGHSRGSRVDLTIIKDGKIPHALVHKKRKLSDGFEIMYLDDGTVDMGSSFDLFDQASWTESTLVPPAAQERRRYLKSVLEKYGFEGYDKEWWHFSYINEPYSAKLESSYFYFPIN